jgi:type I restriction enzyme, S subunit
MNELPDGWEIIPLPDCVYFQEGPGLRKWQFGEAGIPFLNIRTFNNGTIDKTKCQFVKPEEFQGKYEHFLLNDGDIVVSSSGTLGKLAVIREQDLPLMLNTSVIRYRTLYPAQLLQPYLKFFLQSHHFFRQIESAKTGSAISNYGPSHLKEMKIIIAPPAEQRRIVARLEKLLGKVNACQQRLENIPRILKRFRQVVLAAACSGTLTSDWRETQSPKESAQSLLLRIREERKVIWQESRREKGLGVDFRNYSTPVSPTSEFEIDFPDSWTLASMDELTYIITSGSRDWKKYYRDDGPGTFVMAQNVRPLKFDRSFRLGVDPPEDNRDRARSEIRQNDLLVTIVGANTGDVCRVDVPVQNHYVCQSVALMRPVLIATSPFLELFLNSLAHGQEQYRKWIYGEGRPHLSFDHLRATAVALPPLTEQQEIVRLVDTFFKLADQLEARYQRAKAHVDKLQQSILAKAFRGELVPRDPNDEPASMLLERISAERAEGVTSDKQKEQKPATVAAQKRSAHNRTAKAQKLFD